MKRVFISCPPMLGERDQIRELADQHDLELVCGDVVQTLSESDLIRILPEYDGWIAGDDPATSRVIARARAGRLVAVVKWGIGIDNIDIAAIQKHGVAFANTPGMFSSEVADLALGYVIALARGIVSIDREVRRGNWTKLQGMSLAGKVAGVLGLGNIGREVVQRLRVCGLEVIGYDPNVDMLPDAEVVAWPNAIERLDFLVLCCALTPENYHLVGADVLGRFKPSGMLVNVSRGPLVDEQALVRQLQSEMLAGAALDVFETEPLPLTSGLLDHPNVILGSHNASNTKEAVRATNERAVNIVSDMLS